MLERTELVAELVAPGREAFFASRHVQEAVIRYIEVMGEAAKHVPPETRALLPQVDWRGVCGMRDVLIHSYFGVDIHEVWNVATTYVPQLRRLLEEFLSSETV